MTLRMDVVGWIYPSPEQRHTLGLMKGGYRLVSLKKSPSDFLLKDSLEGGFMELGFIF
jgi:hypothetical protein